MISLQPHEYPQDFYYHRTGSPTYRKYLETCNLTIYDIDHPPQYAWKKKIFGDSVVVTKYERTDVEPDIALIRERLGVKHGIVAWIPYSRTTVPKGWKRLYLSDHFQETGIVILDGTDYKKKWNDRSRRALKKFESSGATIRAVSPEEYVEAFRTTKVRHWYKSDYISYYKRMIALDAQSIRQWLCYAPDGTPVAGLAVHDYIGNHSVHLSAFTGKDAYPLQGGTGLIDAWFRGSVELGHKYLSFDQLRQKGGPSEQKGYTEFKKNFIEFGLSFPKAYFKFF